MEKVINGISFDEKIFGKCIDNYSEQLTHASLSVEKSFKILEECDNEIEKLFEEKKDVFNLLKEEEKEEIINNYHFFITYMAYYNKLIKEFDFNDKNTVNNIYNNNFREFDKYMTRLLVFDKNRNYIYHDTGKKVSSFFLNYIKRKLLLKQANDTQLDHIEAFAYALGRESIGVSEIIEINKLTNFNNPNRQDGLKKTNNFIVGSKIQTTTKENASLKLAELVYKYNHDFGMDIKPYDEPDIDKEEKYDRLHKIFLKEARFHILFEHIHPFSDGNGRTGRIILSSNLLRQNIAPPLITSSMFKQYINFINNYCYEELAQMLMDSSSQTLLGWVSVKRAEEGMSISDIITKKI